MRALTPAEQAHLQVARAQLPGHLQRAGVGVELGNLGPAAAVELAELVCSSDEAWCDDGHTCDALAWLGAELVRVLGPRRVGELAGALADFLPAPASVDELDDQALDVLRALAHPDVRFITLDELVQRVGAAGGRELVPALAVLQRWRFVTWSPSPVDSPRYPRATVAATTIGLSYLGERDAGAAEGSH